MIYKEKTKKEYQTKQKIATSKNNYKNWNKNLFAILLKNTPWDKYLYKLKLIQEEKTILSEENIEKKKEILAFNQKLKNSRLNAFFFRPWIKGKKFFKTARQKQLKALYVQYWKTLSLTERKNFFQTHFGEILKKSYLHSPARKGI
jgi:hypothetical protein